jgi:hypothetical protein
MFYWLRFNYQTDQETRQRVWRGRDQRWRDWRWRDWKETGVKGLFFVKAPPKKSLDSRCTCSCIIELLDYVRSCTQTGFVNLCSKGFLYISSLPLGESAKLLWAGRGEQRSVLRFKESEKTGARSARDLSAARTH